MLKEDCPKYINKTPFTASFTNQKEAELNWGRGSPLPSDCAWPRVAITTETAGKSPMREH